MWKKTLFLRIPVLKNTFKSGLTTSLQWNTFVIAHLVTNNSWWKTTAKRAFPKSVSPGKWRSFPICKALATLKFITKRYYLLVDNNLSTVFAILALLAILTLALNSIQLTRDMNFICDLEISTRVPKFTLIADEPVLTYSQPLSYGFGNSSFRLSERSDGND